MKIVKNGRHPITFSIPDLVTFNLLIYLMLKLYNKSYLLFIRNLNLIESCILTRNPIHNSK